MPKKQKKTQTKEVTNQDLNTPQVDPAPETAMQAPVEPVPATATQLSVFDVLQRRMERESAM